MSRSRRKTPIIGITTAASEKKDKQRWHRKFRRKSKQDIEKAPLSKHEVSNLWDMDKDGKWFIDRDSKGMRK